MRNRIREHFGVLLFFARMPNDRYLLENEKFRLYYTSECDESQSLTITVEDNFGNACECCYDIKELGKQLKKIGMLVVQDQVWGRVTADRNAGKATRYYMDEFHLLLKEEQSDAIAKETRKNISGLSYRLMPSEDWNLSVFGKYYNQFVAGPVATDANQNDYVRTTHSLSLIHI